MYGGLMQLVAYGAQDIYLTSSPSITYTTYTTNKININLLEYIKFSINTGINSDINYIIMKYYINNILTKNIKSTSSQCHNNIIYITIDKSKIYRYLDNNDIHCDYLVIKNIIDRLKKYITIIMKKNNIENFEFHN